MSNNERIQELEGVLLFRISRQLVLLSYWLLLPLACVSMLIMGYVCVWMAGFGHHAEIVRIGGSSALDSAPSLGLALMGPASAVVAIAVWRMRSKMPNPRVLFVSK